MTIKDTNLHDQIEDIHVSKFGIYYFLDNLIIGEINKDVVFSWETAHDLFPAIFKHYGEKPTISYISNRINNYTINPTGWFKYFKTANVPNLNSFAIVNSSQTSWLDSSIEELFVQTKFKSFTNLFEAIIWAKIMNAKNKENLLKK